jgi:hypothetical protein
MEAQMKLPTLRQISGFAMIVNTFLPAIVVVTLGLMVWSTAAAIKRNTCATIDLVAQAVNDEGERKKYVAAGMRASEKAQAIADDGERARFLEASDREAKKALEEFAERLRMRPPPAEGSCGMWQELRTRLKDVLTHDIYRKTAEGIKKEIADVDAKFDRVKDDVKKIVPNIPPIKYSGIPGVDQAIWAANQLFVAIREAFGMVGAALGHLGRGLTEPFESAGKNLHEEFRGLDYKRAVAWEILDRFVSDTAALFGKFGWFVVILALWLVLSYGLWVGRRLADAWALLRDREKA